MSGVNPQGVWVRSFKIPSPDELNHDFLWRYTRDLPPRGVIGIYNRSHYEEVLVVRVHPENLERQHLPAESRGKDVWERRFRSSRPPVNHPPTGAARDRCRRPQDSATGYARRSPPAHPDRKSTRLNSSHL